MPSGTSTPAPRMVAQHSVDEDGVCTRLPPEGAVHPLSRRQSRQASPSTRAGAAEQRAAAQDTGATSPTSSVAPTEIVFEAASTLLFGMDNFNNGDPQFDPRASTTSAAEGTGRRGRSRRGRRAAGHVPGPTAAGADGGCAARFSAASGGGAGAVDLRHLQARGPGRRRRSVRSGAASRRPACRRSRPRHPTHGTCRRAVRPAWPTIGRH